MSAHETWHEVLDGRSALVSADQLENLLGHQSVKVFDVRGTWSTSPPSALPNDYDAAHIPGASFLDWTKHFVEQDVPIGLAAVASETEAAQSFKALGIHESDLVILYDDYHHMQAGRIWWAMRFWGLPNVRVLNGGWGYWVRRNKPVSTAAPAIAPGTFKPQKHEELIVDLDGFLSVKDRQCVIDARGAHAYAGTAGDPRTGHIPKSLNVPFRNVLDEETGLFLDPGALAQVFDEKAPQWREVPVITTCGSGYAATVILLALSELGRDARLFDESFSVWKQDPDRPVDQSIPAV